jgi:hypothetical protein
MRGRTKWFLGGLALAVGAVGTAGAYWKRKNMTAVSKKEKQPGDVWARPGMLVTFRAELMPGRDRDERTFRVKELLPSGRVSLHVVDGEHTETEFEPIS